jgi:hypothetical protein
MAPVDARFRKIEHVLIEDERLLKEKIHSNESIFILSYVECITIYGFKRLLNGGKLLNLDPQLLSDQFYTANIDRSGCLTFDELWEWFLPVAQNYHKELKLKQQRQRKKPYGLEFYLVDVFSPKDRALIVLSKRFTNIQSDRSEKEVKSMYGGLKKNKKISHQDDSDEERNDHLIDEMKRQQSKLLMLDSANEEDIAI